MVNQVEDSNKNPYKILLLGNACVGKTNIKNRLNEMEFQPEEISTFGVEVSKLEVGFENNKIVKVDLWDTPGQERFRALTKSYYRNGDAFMLIYDVTNLKSFQDIDIWLEQIRESCLNNVKIVLLGNKIDLNSERKVTKEEGESFAKTKGCLFFEISAKNNENIDTAIKKLILELNANLISNKTEALNIQQKVDDKTGKCPC